MLFSIEKREIKAIPAKRIAEFAAWRKRISDPDYARVVQSIRERCRGQEFVVSSFLPGADWTNTEFQPLFVACGQSKQQAGFFFGLIVWQVMIDDPEKWYFMRASSDDEVLGMRYFRMPKQEQGVHAS